MVLPWMTCGTMIHRIRPPPAVTWSLPTGRWAAPNSPSTPPSTGRSPPGSSAERWLASPSASTRHAPTGQTPDRPALPAATRDPRRCSRLPRERSCTSSENGTTIAPVLLPDPAGATACPTAGRPLAHAAPSSARRQQAGHARNDHGDEAALPAADDVRVLATSREPLRVPGEARYRLAPLALPDPDDLASAARAEAVALSQTGP